MRSRKGLSELMSKITCENGHRFSLKPVAMAPEVIAAIIPCGEVVDFEGHKCPGRIVWINPVRKVDSGA